MRRFALVSCRPRCARRRRRGPRAGSRRRGVADARPDQGDGRHHVRLSRQRGAVLVQGSRRPGPRLQRRAVHARRRRDPEGARRCRAQDRVAAGRGLEPPRLRDRAARSTPSAARRRSRCRGCRTVDFSLPIYVDGGSVLVRAKSKLARLADLKGKRIAVIAGTTTEEELAAALNALGATAVLVPVKNGAEGMALLDQGQGRRLRGRPRRARVPQAARAGPEGLRVRRRRLLVRAVRPARAPRRSRFPAGGEPRARGALPHRRHRRASSSAGWARWAFPGRCCMRCSTSTRCRSDADGAPVSHVSADPRCSRAS